MQIEIEVSPNWNRAMQTKERLLPGMMILGFPFNEGFPKDIEKSCFLLLRDGRIEIARVDISDQYRSEGIAWRTQSGDRIDKHVVAGWAQIVGAA